MKHATVWLVLLALCAPAAHAKSLTLHKAVADGTVVAVCQAESYSRAKLTLLNKTAEPIAVEILGSYMEPLTRRGGDKHDYGVQPLALAFTSDSKRVREVVLQPNKGWEGTLRSFCMRKGASAPDSRTPLRIAHQAAPPLIVRMLGYWHANPKIGQRSVQEVVWQVMGLPAKLRNTTSEEALAALGARQSKLISHLRGSVRMAVSGDGQLFFGKGALEDLRQLGVPVPTIGDSLLVALPNKEQETKLAPHALKGSDDPILPRRYFSVGDHVFASAPGGLYRYDGEGKHWVHESDIGDPQRIVGGATGPLYMLSQGGSLHVRKDGKWKVMRGRFADIVHTSKLGLLALDRRARVFKRWSEGKFKKAMPATAVCRYHATNGRLYRVSPSTGVLDRWHFERKRWVKVADSVKDCWAGTTHLYYTNRSGQLWLDWDEADEPRVIEAKVGNYFVACVRMGKDHLYMKTRAHLVIVYDPKHDQ